MKQMKRFHLGTGFGHLFHLLDETEMKQMKRFHLEAVFGRLFHLPFHLEMFATHLDQNSYEK